MTLASTTDSSLVVSRSRGDHPVLVVSVLGGLDGTTSQAFRRRVVDILREPGSARVLVLDLTELHTLSPSGLSATHQMCRHARAAGLDVLLVSTGPLRRLIDLVGQRAPATPYQVVGTRREAIAIAGHFRRRRRRPGYGPVPTILAG